MSGKIKVVNGESVADRILKEVKDENVSMIVVGTRGQGTIRRTLLGSVSSSLVHNADVPVIVAPLPPKE